MSINSLDIGLADRDSIEFRASRSEETAWVALVDPTVRGSNLPSTRSAGVLSPKLVLQVRCRTASAA